MIKNKISPGVYENHPLCVDNEEFAEVNKFKGLKIFLVWNWT